MFSDEGNDTASLLELGSDGVFLAISSDILGTILPFMEIRSLVDLRRQFEQKNSLDQYQYMSKKIIKKLDKRQH